MQQMRTATWPTKDGGSETFEMVDGVARDILEGKEVMKNDMDMGGAKVTNLGDAVNDGDALPKGQAAGLFAPSGYGLGETNGKTCTDANTATLNSFYSMIGSGATNVPAGYEYAQLTVTRRNYDIYQFLIQNGIILFRQSADGGENWGEWSFVNPPMVLGVEYRTVERWNGKTVYTALLNLGYGPNNGTFDINTNLVATQPIRATARIAGGGSNQTVPYENNTESVSISGFANAQAQLFASLRTNFNATSKVIWAQFWYIKE